MCWSFEVSLFTFVAAILASAYLFRRNQKNDRLYAVYIFVVGLVQGAEALAWYAVNNDQKSLRSFSGMLTEAIIMLQIVFVYGYMYYKTRNSIYLVILAIYLGVLIRIVSTHKKYDIEKTCNENAECGLSWSWLEPNTGLSPGVLLLYFIPLGIPLFITQDRRRFLMVLIPILTYIFSVYKFGKTKLWGGYWCLTSNLWIPVALCL